MQKARRHQLKSRLRPLVSTWFQGLFHSSVRGSFHLSLTVLVHYRSSGEYLALADGPARFTQDFTCPALLRIPVGLVKKSCTGLSPSTMQLSRCFHFSDVVPQPGPTTPVLPKQHRFGLIPFRSPLLRESLNCFLFLWVLRCFSSPRSPPELTG